MSTDTILAYEAVFTYSGKMISIADVQKLCNDEAIVLTEHLLTRMRQRGIKYGDLKQTIQNGEVIEQYPTDYPFPSCLISSVDLHIVCSIGESVLYIITASPHIVHPVRNGKKMVKREGG
ncbi:hypothetical protein AGMMS50212_11870 [Spirochaetia bacterium]|nr:hypothetical protein AGMMS50212_11870 [Spirochaetia bacterium]